MRFEPPERPDGDSAHATEDMPVSAPQRLVSLSGTVSANAKVGAENLLCSNPMIERILQQLLALDLIDGHALLINGVSQEMLVQLNIGKGPEADECT